MPHLARIRLSDDAAQAANTILRFRHLLEGMRLLLSSGTIVHSLTATPANVTDITELPNL